jgi:hypothetical protein
MARQMPGPEDDVNIPLIFQFQQRDKPGAVSLALIGARRHAETMARGGFMDVMNPVGASSSRIARAKRFGAYVGDDLTAPTRKALGSSSPFKFVRNAGDKLNNKFANLAAKQANTLHPKSLGRYHSVSALGEDESKMFRVGSQIADSTNWVASRLGTAMPKVGIKMGMEVGADGKVTPGQRVISKGVLGRITTMNKLHDAEHFMEVGRQQTLAGTLTKRGAKRVARAEKTVQNISENTVKLHKLANPALHDVGAIASEISGAFPVPAGMAPMYEAQAAARVGNLVSTIRSNPMDYISGSADSAISKGTFTNRITAGYKRVLDPMQNESVRKVFMRGAEGPLNPSTLSKFAKGGEFGGGWVGRAKGGFNIIGESFGAGLAEEVGAKVALKAGAVGLSRVAGAVLEPLNVFATGQMVYDIAKFGGKVLMKGENFAKDALKSMQGSINKPIFGAGFKDNEVAATSRARGVMAIQNSRLNARSLLGSEAGMMAAHFG